MIRMHTMRSFISGNMFTSRQSTIWNEVSARDPRFINRRTSIADSLAPGRLCGVKRLANDSAHSEVLKTLSWNVAAIPDAAR